MYECVFIYRTYHIMSHGGLQFSVLSEIGRQLIQGITINTLRPREKKQKTSQHGSRSLYTVFGDIK